MHSCFFFFFFFLHWLGAANVIRMCGKEPREPRAGAAAWQQLLCRLAAGHCHSGRSASRKPKLRACRARQKVAIRSGRCPHGSLQAALKSPTLAALIGCNDICRRSPAANPFESSLGVNVASKLFYSEVV